MIQRRQDSDAQADVGQQADPGQPDALHPLLQRKANVYTGDAPIHGAFRVDAADDIGFIVGDQARGRQYPVRRAASCLLMPQPGDKVLVSGDAAGGLYIIAVLEQAQRGSTTLHVEGELALSADVLALKATSRVSLETDAFALRARSGAVDAADWTVKSHSYTLASVNLSVASIAARYTGDHRESYFQSVRETTGQSTRYVAGTDTVQAVNLDYAADFIARLSGDTTFINGETLVKADGKQILVG
ncbi:DUF3540 domain-containing protein [Bordetella genomosp. 13]|uniref:DUF3540 domain-containing protein n=1 Tax=Bordetella genomosp. 13 TaxID=463040 RepID=UPI0016428E2C|nr:DUF3540 domain-containing protein [Bordetella genomosp. 13]